MNDIHDTHPNEDLLQSFLDGDLPNRERRRIEEHVTSCTHCSAELEGWRLLFEDLDGLGVRRPGADFEARVMAGVRIPDEVPWAARVKGWFTAVLPSSGPRHLEADVLQDLAEGVLKPRRAAPALTHLEGCVACANELDAWSAVMARLSELDRVAPGAGFADEVMFGFAAAKARQATPIKAPARAPGWQRALTGAKRFVPRTRRAWAAISGAAVTPAVTFGLVLWAVFSHPTLTPQALASFAFWQLTDLFFAGWTELVAGGLDVARITGIEGLVEALVQAPLLAAAGIGLYAIGVMAAVRVLYKNLIDGRSLRHRYASASAS